MVDQQQIKAGMAVADTNGESVGTVDRLDADMVALSGEGFSDGLHHFVPIAAVKRIDGGKLIVAPGEASTIEAVTGAVDYSRAHAPTSGAAGLFGTSGHGTGMGGSGSGH